MESQYISPATYRDLSLEWEDHTEQLSWLITDRDRSIAKIDGNRWWLYSEHRKLIRTGYCSSLANGKQQVWNEIYLFLPTILEAS